MKNLILSQEQVKELFNYIEQRKARSAWDKGVKQYAIELLAAVLTFKFATVLSVIILAILALHIIGELIYIFKTSKK